MQKRNLGPSSNYLTAPNPPPPGSPSSAQNARSRCASRVPQAVPAGPLPALRVQGSEGHRLLLSLQQDWLLLWEGAIDVFANSVSLCQPVTHCHPVPGDRVPAVPQALPQQEETAIILAEGQNVPKREKSGSRQEWAAPSPPHTPESSSLLSHVLTDSLLKPGHSLYLNCGKCLCLGYPLG